MFLSLEQIIIDVEVFRRCLRLSEGINTSTKEWLEVDLASVGHGGNFLGRRSTIDALRRGEIYVSDFDARQSYESWSASGKPSLIHDIKGALKEILKDHHSLPLDEDVIAELEKIEQRARENPQAMKTKG
jgi:trimethylamine:corrinoid methyltransferase-like protein